MRRYVCQVCGYIYDPKGNNNVSFQDLPDDWVCPTCGAGKDEFKPEENELLVEETPKAES